MSTRIRTISLSLLALGLIVSAGLPRAAQAGVSDTVLALAGPLAEQFGVSPGLVTGLLEGGVSLESATQLLLVGQSASTKLEDVTKLYREQGDSVLKAAEELGVDAADYSQAKVSAAIDQATATAQAAATDKATEEAGKALGSALGGLTR